MPSYNATPARSLTIGDAVNLYNAATDGAVTATQQVAVGQTPAPGSNSLAMHNNTNQAATVQVAYADANANYVPLTDGDTGIAITAAAGSSIVFSCVGPFVRALFGTAPSSGTLYLTR
jgi:hypothetical protein